MHAYISKQARKTRGSGGCSPRKFLEIRCSEIASGAIFGQKQSPLVATTIFDCPIHAFAKLADFKFPREKVLKLAEQ